MKNVLEYQVIDSYNFVYFLIRVLSAFFYVKLFTCFVNKHTHVSNFVNIVIGQRVTCFITLFRDSILLKYINNKRGHYFLIDDK